MADSTSYAKYTGLAGGGSFSAADLTDAGTDGITITGGTGAVNGTGTQIAQHVADATHNGYLSSVDWNTFNIINTVPADRQRYVSVAGNDSTGNGTFYKPFLTLAAAETAITNATSSVQYVINIGPGTFVAPSTKKPNIAWSGTGRRWTFITFAAGGMLLSNGAVTSSVMFKSLNMQMGNSQPLTFTQTTNVGGSLTVFMYDVRGFGLGGIVFNGATSGTSSLQTHGCEFGTNIALHSVLHFCTFTYFGNPITVDATSTLANAGFTFPVNTTNASQTVSVTGPTGPSGTLATSGILQGQAITGTGIPAGALVGPLNTGANTFVISLPATATNTGTTATFKINVQSTLQMYSGVHSGLTIGGTSTGTLYNVFRNAGSLTVNDAGTILALTSDAMNGVVPTIASGATLTRVSDAKGISFVPATSGDWTVQPTQLDDAINVLAATKANNISLAAVGSSPNANAATFASSILTLQPADATHPGALTAIAQAIGGDKTFAGSINAQNGINLSVVPSILGADPNAMLISAYNGAAPDEDGSALTIKAGDATQDSGAGNGGDLFIRTGLRSDGVPQGTAHLTAGNFFINGSGLVTPGSWAFNGNASIDNNNILNMVAQQPLNFYDADTSDRVSIYPPTSVTSYDIILPSTQGAANTTLSNDGSGVLSWTPFIGFTLPTSNSVYGGVTASGGMTGVANTAVGALTLAGVTSGDHNTGFGLAALNGLSTGSNNVAVGVGAGEIASSASENTLIGAFAGGGVNTGAANVLIGKSAGVGVSTADYNICIGTQSATGLTTGGGNIYIGSVNSAASSSVTGECVIGGDFSDISRFNLGHSQSFGGTPSGTVILSLGGDAAGADISGAGRVMQIAGVAGTGAGAGGDVRIATAPAGGSGSSVNALVDQVYVKGDGRVGIGATPTTSAALDVQSTTGAFMPPRMTTTQRNALTAAKGMIIYNTSTDQFQGYDGAWKSFTII